MVPNSNRATVEELTPKFLEIGARRALPSKDHVEILECTLRDGSYAVDFRFTERDTEVLVGVLGRLGFKWIEVGHGVGLGAAHAGKGAMPTTDERLIEVAKRAAPHTLIGSFFIPGIGTTDHLKSARDAGLDFVRIGCNATEIEEAFPYLATALKLGITPCLNFMKTYGISPAEFAEKARAGIEAGAEIIYCVDSAGSMLPEDVTRYFTAAQEACDCTLGFHGHSNLQFAVANSVAAYRAGARMIDTTLYGLGRSSGNVPTEVAVAVFSKLGIETGIDLFEVMDAAENFLGPLMSQMQLYDMMSVAMGYSQFHSSFLPKVAAAAGQHGVDLRRLVVAMGEVDPVNLDEKALEEIAKSLPKTSTRKEPEVLTSFRATGISSHGLSTSFAAVQSLVEGMTTVCAKRRARPALELVASETASNDLVLADLVLAEDGVVLGRITYGSFDILKQVLLMTRDVISVFLIDLDGGAWGTALPPELPDIAGAERIIPIRSKRLVAGYLEEVIMSVAQRFGDFCLLIYGSPNLALLQHCAESFRNVAVRGVLPVGASDNCWQLDDFSDHVHVDLNIAATLLLCSPDSSDAHSIDQLMQAGGILITAGYFPRLEQELPVRTILRFDPNQAYRGQMARWMAVSKFIRSS